MNDVQRLVPFLKRHLTYDQFAGLLADEVPMTGPWGLRRWLAERDVEAFAKLYLPEEFYLDLAPIHRSFVRDIEDMRSRQLKKVPGLKLVRAVPRGHSKSTFYSRVGPLHGLLYQWSPLTILLGNNSTAAERLVKNIKDETSSNDRLAEDFGDVKGDVWQTGHLQARNGATIRCYGVGSGAVRGVSKPGQRPSMVVGDDLDDDQSVRSAVQLASNTEWFTKAILPLGDQVMFTTSFVMVGTVIRSSSLMSHILRSPEFEHVVERGVIQFSDEPALWDAWKEWYITEAKAGRKPLDADHDEFYQHHRERMLAGTKVLWDRPNAYYTLMLYRMANGEQSFWSEIMNEPSEAGGALGKMPVKALPEDLKGWEKVAALDPTMRGGKANDLSAWVEAWFNRSTKEVIVSKVDAQQRPHGKTVEDAVKHIAGGRFSALWIEGNSGGIIICDAINERLDSRGVYQSIVSVDNSAPKDERIGTLSLYAARRQFFVSPDVDEEFEREWSGFPSYRFDDAIDAAATIVIQLHKAGLLNLIDGRLFDDTEEKHKAAKRLIEDWTTRHGLQNA